MQFSLFRFRRISGVFINKFLYWASIILKSRALANWAIGAYGAPGRTRTCNLRFRRPLLYPVELLGHFLFIALRWYSSRKNAEQLNHSASIISSNNFYWLIKLWSNKLVFLVFLLLAVFLFICIITFSPLILHYCKFCVFVVVLHLRLELRKCKVWACHVCQLRQWSIMTWLIIAGFTNLPTSR